MKKTSVLSGVAVVLLIMFAVLLSNMILPLHATIICGHGNCNIMCVGTECDCEDFGWAVICWCIESSGHKICPPPQ